MRSWTISAAVILICSTFALAQAPSRVIVAPLTEANEQHQPDWVNRAIHQAVSDELASLSAVEVVPVQPTATSPSTALAKGAGAKFMVRGTIQRINGEIRVTGRVEKVEDGTTVGGFKATGPQYQLFAIEDSIARQLKRVLAPMEADAPLLEDARPVATGPTRDGGYGPQQTPIQPIRGVYEGSDLQRALDDRDYLNRTARRGEINWGAGPGYCPPTYPATYGPPYGYGGYGYGFGSTNIVIIKGRKHGHHGGHHGGGVVTRVTPRVPIQTIQTQRLRDAAVFPGPSGNFIGPVPHRAPVGGTKHPTQGR